MVCISRMMKFVDDEGRDIFINVESVSAVKEGGPTAKGNCFVYTCNDVHRVVGAAIDVVIAIEDHCEKLQRIIKSRL